MHPPILPDQIDAHRLLVQVEAGRSTASYQCGQRIFAQGDDAASVFFIQAGSVKLTTLQNGVETLLGIADQGQFFGEACLYDVPVRVATATAITDCRITSVTRDVMLSTIRSNPKFARMFIEFLSEKNSWTQKHLLDHLLRPQQSS